MLAELFLENGNAVMAVEPNAEMRAECERLCERFARLRVVDGTAEWTGLDAGSVEMVSAGRAFHWFEPVGAAAEFRRVVKPGGWVMIAESGRSREETEQARAFEALLMKHGTDLVHVRDRYRRVDRNVAFLRSISDREPRHVEFAEELVMGLEAFVGWTQSMSIAPLPGTVGYAAMRGALEEFFGRWSVDGVLRVEMVCLVDVGRVGGA